MPEINYLAVLVSGVAAMVLGGIWYGPLFGKLWMQGMGWDPNNKELMEQKKKSAGPAYVQMFILALVQACVLAHVINIYALAYLDAGPAALFGLLVAAFMWLGFILPIKYGDKLWGGKAFKFVAIDLGYYLVQLLAMGVMISVWR